MAHARATKTTTAPRLSVPCVCVCACVCARAGFAAEEKKTVVILPALALPCFPGDEMEGEQGGVCWDNVTQTNAKINKIKYGQEVDDLAIAFRVAMDVVPVDCF